MIVRLETKVRGPYDVPSEKSRMPVSPLRSGRLGNVIEISGRKSGPQTAETLIPNCPVGMELDEELLDELDVVLVEEDVVEEVLDVDVDPPGFVVVVCSVVVVWRGFVVVVCWPSVVVVSHG